MTAYAILIDGKPGGPYGVVVPDLPGCFSAGGTREKARANAIEAVRMWIDDAVADGKPIPTPRGMGALRRDPEVVAALAEGAVLARLPRLWLPGVSV